ncbi:unnamed protein product [Brachionus calyciflorus]|uniref:RRM domain-containing protein n=1 Tax=Brachionus calyciflorus TaxID=104777 RepID=A0A813RK91_9BILA|nr:unnamed protein product [Brachionus calyciflorus]
MKNLPESQAKIFIGGLSWNTTKEMLANEFMKYGEIIDSIVMRNPETGASRGYGFITFKDLQSAEMALNSGVQHTIDGKIVDVKTCSYQQRQEMNSYGNISLSLSNLNKYNNCKVFVGGLPHGTQDMDVVNYFSRYGNVIEFKMMYDETKSKPRGFGFLTFEQEESAVQVLKQHYFQFNGKQIEIKPQSQNVKQKQQFPQMYNQIPPQKQHHHHQHHHQQQQQGYINNWGNQPKNTNWNNQQKNFRNNNNNNHSMQNQFQNQQWGNPGFPSTNNPLFPIQPPSNWNNYNFYGQAGGTGQPQSNAYFPLDGATAGLTGAGAGYPS